VEGEKSISVMRFAGQWRDLGTWNTLTEAMSENAIGKVVLDDQCANVHVVNDLDIPVIALGLKDVVVAASPDGILVSDKERSGYVKDYVEKLEEQVRFAEKSWGEYRVLDMQEESETVKITIHAGHRLSYHSHEHRDEMWTIISGKGRTIVDGMEQNVEPGDVITMQAGCRHTVFADTELQIIEVQIGKEISSQDKIKYELEW
jgi:mannose-1-phosphate guanylyltransferase